MNNLNAARERLNAAAKEALEVFGRDVEIDVAIEEMLELSKELLNLKRRRAAKEDVLHELADVHMGLANIQSMIGATDEELAAQMDRASSRLLKRCEEERANPGKSSHYGQAT